MRGIPGTRCAWGVRALAATTLAVPMAVGFSAPAAADTEAAEEAIPWCTVDDLKIMENDRGAAAGTTYIELAFLKISDGTSCQMAGYANMHWVDGPDGEMVGDWASHEGGSSEPFVLDPGDWAQATVAQPHAENFPPEECVPREVPGMSVIVDDDAEGERAYVPTGGRDVACANPEVGQPRLTNVTPGGA